MFTLDELIEMISPTQLKDYLAGYCGCVSILSQKHTKNNKLFIRGDRIICRCEDCLAHESFLELIELGAKELFAIKLFYGNNR